MNNSTLAGFLMARFKKVFINSAFSNLLISYFNGCCFSLSSLSFVHFLPGSELSRTSSSS